MSEWSDRAAVTYGCARADADAEDDLAAALGKPSGEAGRHEWAALLGQVRALTAVAQAAGRVVEDWNDPVRSGWAIDALAAACAALKER